MAYFDNNACVPMTDAILKQYSLGAKLGNISNESSSAAMGQFHKAHLTKNLATMFPGMRIIYTSGGTESNATALHQYLGGHIVCPMSEHSSIIAKVRNENVSWIRPQPTGHIKVDEILAATQNNTKVIILQSINSETGAIQDLINLVTRNQNKIPIHCDHVQGFMKLPEITSFVNYCLRMGQKLSMSISFHKIGGPIGFGALITNMNIPPLISGSQNDGLRGGTYNIAAIYASIQAMKDYSYDRIRSLRALFDSELNKKFVVLHYNQLEKMISSGAKLSSSGYIVIFGCEECLPHTIFMVVGRDNEIICNKVIRDGLAAKGITVGFGSACNTGKEETLGSMRSANIQEALKNGFIRISLSCYNSPNEIKKLIKVLHTLI